MTPMLPLLPFALFIIVLPFPGTVALRMLLLAICFGIAFWQWWRIPGARAAIPCKPALLLWGGVCVASLVYTGDLAYTASELKNELGYTMMAFFSFFVIAADRAAAIWLFRAIGAGLAFIGLWATLAWAGSGFVWNELGYYGGIGGFSTYLVTIVPVLVWLIFADPLAYMRRIAMGLLLFTVFLAVISMQRATWLALAAQALIILAHAFHRRLLAIDWRGVVVAGVAIVVIAAAGAQHIQQARFSNVVGETQMTDDVRWSFWPKVTAKIVGHPLVGVGFGRSMMHKTYPDLTPREVPDLWHAHNVLLNYGLQLGIPGIIAFLVLFAAFAHALFRSIAQGDGWTGVAGIAIIVGVLLRNQFNDFFVRDMSLLFWALLATFVRISIAKKPEDRKTSPKV
jgi:O-antigen ligase